MPEPTIIVADDHADLRMMIRRLLVRGTGWNVVEAEDGDSALAAYGQCQADLLVLDERMPGKTGTEVAESLRNNGFDRPIVVFSAYLDPDVEERAAKLGLVTLSKSDIDQLVGLVRQLITDHCQHTSA